MNVAGYLLKPLYWLAGRIFSLWARPTVQPEDPAELIAAEEAPVFYVLESGGLADLQELRVRGVRVRHGCLPKFCETVY